MRRAGFTLVELMIAVAILAIIAAVALPIYNQYSERTYRSEAMADLLNCAQGLERYAAVEFDYEGADAVFPGNICDPRSVAQGRYNIAVNIPNADEFVLTATPVGVMAGDGILTYDSAGVRGWDRDNSGAVDAGEDTWEE
jgi:type IV pilus assembly protein PilE